MDDTGIVTGYFPFMDNAQKEYVRELLHDAANYAGFVTALVDGVCVDEKRVGLLPFAQRCAWALGSLPLLERLVSAFGVKASSLPWHIHAMRFIGQIPTDEMAVQQIRASLSSDADRWVRFEAETLIADMMGNYDPVGTLRALEDLEEQAKEDTRYEWFSANLRYLRGGANLTMDDRETADRLLEESVTLAERVDDLFTKGSALLMRSATALSPGMSLEYLSEARRMFHALGNSVLDGTIENNMGFYRVARAEHDQAIEHYQRAIEIHREMGIDVFNPYLNIAVLYGNIGRTDKALEYASQALEVARRTNPDYPSPQMEMARALILSGRNDEAYEYLEAGGELAFKRGPKKELCRYYLIRGMLETSRGNHSAALSTLKRGLRIAEDTGEVYYVLQTLLQLAGAEILALAQRGDEERSSGPLTAVVRLEQLAREQSLPGLSVQVLLLKAELEKLRGRKDLARKRLDEALAICDSEGLHSLRSAVQARTSDKETPKTRKSLLEWLRSLIRQIAVPSGQVRRIPFVVMGCIVILRDSGLEGYSQYIDPKITSDPSLVAGLITAVSSFARELREDTSGNLQSIIHQDIAVLLEHGSSVTCALLTDKDTYEARVIERRFVERFEEAFSESLKEFVGGMAQPLDAQAIFQSVVVQRNHMR
ncbi:MAG: tetratricopeptide repeat protein [Candidatus Thorarchaeota archaeon]|nr:tetratricopeptide repeat protein [Candidatus Thorarchaeota archaeon]